MKIQIHPSIRPLAASHDRLTQGGQRTRSVSRVSPCQTWCWGGSFLLLHRLPLFGFFKHPTLLFSHSTLPLLWLSILSLSNLRSILREPSKTFGRPRNIVHICKDGLLQRGFGQDRLQLRCSKKIWSEAIIVMLISAGWLVIGISRSAALYLYYNFFSHQYNVYNYYKCYYHY